MALDCIELKDLGRIYLDEKGRSFHALDHISLVWEEGSSIAVMGRSGSGKSTLARLMAGLERPSEGAVFINGEDTSKWSFSRWKRQRAMIQAVFQDAGGTLNPALSARRNVEEALYNFSAHHLRTPDGGYKLRKRRRILAEERAEKIAELMEQTGLRRELLDIPVRKLSGGEQRRMALLRSLSVDPEFLILDEVTAGLDLISTEAVWKLLERYQREHDCAYLMITHDLQTASRLCGTIYEIEHGRILRKAVRR